MESVSILLDHSVLLAVADAKTDWAVSLPCEYPSWWPFGLSCLKCFSDGINLVFSELSCVWAFSAWCFVSRRCISWGWLDSNFCDLTPTKLSVSKSTQRRKTFWQLCFITISKGRCSCFPGVYLVRSSIFLATSWLFVCHCMPTNDFITALIKFSSDINPDSPQYWARIVGTFGLQGSHRIV